MPRKKYKFHEAEWTSSMPGDSKVSAELKKLTNSPGWVAASQKLISSCKSPGSSRASTPPSTVSSSSRRSSGKNSKNGKSKKQDSEEYEKKKFKMVLEKDEDFEVDYVSPDEATADDSDLESKEENSDGLSHDDDFSLDEDEEVSSIDNQYSDIEVDEDVPVLELPESSIDLLLPNDLVLPALGIYEILRHFRSCLRLSPMLFEDFCAALVDVETNILLTECFISVLKALLREEDAAGVQFGPPDQKDSVHVAFNFLDHMTWPEVARSYLESSSEFTPTLMVVKDPKFPNVDAKDKISVLKMLTDTYLASNKIRDQLMTDGVIHYDDHCRVCHKLGDLLCCETCTAVYHLACCDPPLEEVPEDEWQCEVCRAHKLNGVYNCEPQHEFRGQYLRHDPLGTDRHGNKYWFLARRLIIEGSDHVWYYSTQEQFDSLMSVLDPDKYEMVLCEALKDVAEEFPKCSKITQELTEEALPDENTKAYLDVFRARLKKEAEERKEEKRKEEERKRKEEEKKREEEERKKKEEEKKREDEERKEEEGKKEQEDMPNSNETSAKIDTPTSQTSSQNNQPPTPSSPSQAPPPTHGPQSSIPEIKETTSVNGGVNNRMPDPTINTSGANVNTDSTATTTTTSSNGPQISQNVKPVANQTQNRNIQVIKLGGGIQVKTPVRSQSLTQLKTLFVVNKDGTKTPILLGPAGKIVAPANNASTSSSRQIVVLNSAQVALPKVNRELKKLEFAGAGPKMADLPLTRMEDGLQSVTRQRTQVTTQPNSFEKVKEMKPLTHAEEAEKYFRLGEDKAYRQYVNHFSENPLALNKYQHKEERDRERYLGYKFSMNGAGEFKWSGDALGSQETVSQALRATLMHLEHQIPLCFMHTRWEKYRNAWGKMVMKCNSPQSFAAALGILEMATRGVVKRAIWHDGNGLTKLQRVTSGEKEDFERKRKHKNRTEEDISNKNAVWCKYPIPVRSMLVWKMKGEEYRMTGYGGWMWVSSTRQAVHKPFTPKDFTIVHVLDSDKRSSVTSVNSSEKKQLSTSDIDTDSEKSTSTTSTTTTKSVDLSEERVESATVVSQSSNDINMTSQTTENSSKIIEPMDVEALSPTNDLCEETKRLYHSIISSCDVINVSENLLKRTPIYNKKWSASKVDILLGWRLMQRDKKKVNAVTEVSKIPATKETPNKPMPLNVATATSQNALTPKVETKQLRVKLCDVKKENKIETSGCKVEGQGAGHVTTVNQGVESKSTVKQNFKHDTTVSQGAEHMATVNQGVKSVATVNHDSKHNVTVSQGVEHVATVSQSTVATPVKLPPKPVSHTLEPSSCSDQPEKPSSSVSEQLIDTGESPTFATDDASPTPVNQASKPATTVTSEGENLKQHSESVGSEVKGKVSTEHISQKETLVASEEMDTTAPGIEELGQVAQIEETTKLVSEETETVATVAQDPHIYRADPETTSNEHSEPTGQAVRGQEVKLTDSIDQEIETQTSVDDEHRASAGNKRDSAVDVTKESEEPISQNTDLSDPANHEVETAEHVIQEKEATKVVEQGMVFVGAVSDKTTEHISPEAEPTDAVNHKTQQVEHDSQNTDSADATSHKAEPMEHANQEETTAVNEEMMGTVDTVCHTTEHVSPETDQTEALNHKVEPLEHTSQDKNTTKAVEQADPVSQKAEKGEFVSPEAHVTDPVNSKVEHTKQVVQEAMTAVVEQVMESSDSVAKESERTGTVSEKLEPMEHANQMEARAVVEQVLESADAVTKESEPTVSQKVEPMEQVTQEAVTAVVEQVMESSDPVAKESERTGTVSQKLEPMEHANQMEAVFEQVLESTDAVTKESEPTVSQKVEPMEQVTQEAVTAVVEQVLESADAVTEPTVTQKVEPMECVSLKDEVVAVVKGADPVDQKAEPTEHIKQEKEMTEVFEQVMEVTDPVTKESHPAEHVSTEAKAENVSKGLETDITKTSVNSKASDVTVSDEAESETIDTMTETTKTVTTCSYVTTVETVTTTITTTVNKKVICATSDKESASPCGGLAESSSGIQQTAESSSGIQQTAESSSGIQQTAESSSGIQQTADLSSGIQQTAKPSSDIHTAQSSGGTPKDTKTSPATTETSHIPCTTSTTTSNDAQVPQGAAQPKYVSSGAETVTVTTTVERSRIRSSRMSRIKRETTADGSTLSTTKAAWKLQRYRKATTVVKKEQAMKLPLPWKFFGGKRKKKSIFRLPKPALRKMALSGGLWQYSDGFNYGAKFYSGLEMFWIYLCPRPAFHMVWRYKLQNVTTFASVAHLLRVFWHSVKWDEVTTRPQTDDVVHTVTTDEAIVTTELLKRKDNLTTGLHSQYFVRRITMPILDPEEEALRAIKPGDNYTPSRKGLRSSTRPINLRERPKRELGPQVETVWLPEEQVELWQIRQFDTMLKQQMQQHKSGISTTVTPTGPNTFIATPSGAILPTLQAARKQETVAMPSLNIVRLPIQKVSHVSNDSLSSLPGTPQSSQAFLNRKTFSTMVGKTPVQKIVVQPPNQFPGYKQVGDVQQQAIIRSTAGGTHYIVQGGKLVKPIVIKAGSQVVTTPLQARTTHPTIRLNDTSSQLIKFQQQPPPAFPTLKKPTPQTSPITPRTPQRSPNQTQIKLSSSQLAQLMKVGVGTHVRVSVSLGNGRAGVGQIQLIPPGAQVTPSAGQQLMQTKVGGEVKRFLLTLLSETTPTTVSSSTQANEVCLQTASLSQRLQQMQKHQHQAYKRQSTDMRRLLTDKDPLWGSRPQTPERTFTRREVDRPKKRPMSREEREDSQRNTVVHQVMKSILDRIEHRENMELRKRKREEAILKQKEKKEMTEQAKVHSRQTQILHRHRDQLKQEILKRRAVVEKYLTHMAKNELREDQRKQRRHTSLDGAPVSKRPKKTFGNAIITSAVLTENNSKRPIDGKKDQQIAAKRRRTQSPPPRNRKQQMINTHARKNKDTKLYCVCKTPYDDTKFYIGCDLCMNWFHGSCVGITETRAKSMNEWVCDDCKRVQEEPAQELYCLCRTPYDESKFYIGCDICQDWYHGTCVGVTEKESEAIDFYTCPRCLEKSKKGQVDAVKENKLMPDDYFAMTKIIKSLRAHKMAWPFLQPVSKLEVPNYYKVIKKPMDLGTILHNLRSYTLLSEFVGDVSLIFDNCRMFNGADSPLAKCAEIVESVFVGKMREYRARVGRK